MSFGDGDHVLEAILVSFIFYLLSALPGQGGTQTPEYVFHKPVGVGLKA